MAAALAAVLLSCTVLSGAALALEPWATECYVLSEGACLMDAGSGVILYGKNADSQYYPASITKVLTALLVVENCDNLSEIVTFSYDAVHLKEENSTIIGASEGDRLSVLDCLYCLLFQSANEVANALGEHVGAKHPELKEKGQTDLDVFVRMMNEKAASLGCTGSHFNNPSGLTDSDHYTTPHDMCLIMQAAINNPVFRDIESHTYWKHAPIRRYPDADDPQNTVYMKHLMLRKNSSQYYKGCIAGKTGYTTTAGNTLVTACERDGMTLVVCVMNAHANHYTDTEQLFNFGFANFRSVSVSDYDLTVDLVQHDFRIEEVPVLDSYTVGIREDSRITIPKGGDYMEVTRKFVTEDLSSQDALAEFRFYYGDRPAGAAAVTLMPLGGMSEVKEAEEDPLFYQVSGKEMPTEETSAEDASQTEENGESAAESAGAEQTGSASGDAAAEETGTASENAASENIAGNGEDGAAEPPESAEETDGTAEEKKGVSVVTIVLIAVGVLAAAGIFLFLKARAEKKEAERRSRRRRQQMRAREDLTGSQNIDIDLEVQRRLRKNERKKR